MTDLKQLCKDLADDLSMWMEYEGSPQDLPFEQNCTHLLLKRAYAELAASVEPESIEDRIAQLDVAIEVSMERIRKIASMPAAQLAAERRAVLATINELENQ